MNYDYKQLNQQSHKAIPVGNIRVAPYAIEQLLEVEIRQSINEHSTLFLKGILADDKTAVAPNTNAPIESLTDILDAEEKISLSVLDASGDEYILFQGLVRELEIQTGQGSRFIELQAVSCSYVLDIERKSRSFQNKNMTYAALLKQVTDSYDNAGVIDLASHDAPTNQFILQHQETDWEFLKRLASHFHTGLVCDVRFNVANYFFGIPKAQSISLDSLNYKVRRDLQRLHKLESSGLKDLRAQDFICYEIETNCIVRIGDEFIFRGEQLYVSEILNLAENDVLINRLTLAPKGAFSQPYLPQSPIAGMSLGGRVLEASNDRLKLSLDLDQGHEPGEPCFFPYATIYSSPDGSGWYCMPEQGDTVRLYFPDAEADHAYIISSVHEAVNKEPPRESLGANNLQPANGSVGAPPGSEGEYSGLRDDPQVKSLTYGDKEIRLTPEGVHIITSSSKISLTNDTLSLVSKNDIALKSDKNIIMSAENGVNISGSASVEITCGETAGVMIEDNVQLIGQKVNAN
ncbi:MAG: phage late control D family protein [Peptococcaceae bacterium]|jgi:hypothetical protein|nr:phage late control D family protein [Peptococcaceae bacterium]